MWQHTQETVVETEAVRAALAGSAWWLELLQDRPGPIEVLRRHVEPHVVVKTWLDEPENVMPRGGELDIGASKLDLQPARLDGAGRLAQTDLLFGSTLTL